MGRHSLLTKDDEVRLARAIEAGTQAATLLGQERHPPARELELREMVEAGRRAQATFVRSNLRLVVSIAKRRQGAGMATLDLIQEGNLGLIHAVKKFDWRKGFRFSTYAGWWISESMSRAAAGTGRPMKMPTRVEHEVTLLERARARLEASSDEPITAASLGAEAGMDEARATQLLRFRTRAVLLSEAVGHDGDLEIGDVLPDGSTPPAVDIVAASLLPTVVTQLLAFLDDRERQVLRLRFGLDEGRPHTLGEVGKQLGLTRERIRQIEKAALSKLRRPASDMEAHDLLAS